MLYYMLVMILFKCYLHELDMSVMTVGQEHVWLFESQSVIFVRVSLYLFYLPIYF